MNIYTNISKLTSIEKHEFITSIQLPICSKQIALHWDIWAPHLYFEALERVTIISSKGQYIIEGFMSYVGFILVCSNIGYLKSIT
jgi:hypothetical protein